MSEVPLHSYKDTYPKYDNTRIGKRTEIEAVQASVSTTVGRRNLGGIPKKPGLRSLRPTAVNSIDFTDLIAVRCLVNLNLSRTVKSPFISLSLSWYG